MTRLNNTFENVNITLDPTAYWYDQIVNSDMRLVADNNLFKDGGWLVLEPFPTSAGNWTFENNLFDKIDFLQDTNQPLDFDYNGYWPMQASELLWGGDSGQLLPAAGGNLVGANEQVLSNAPLYQCGPFGKFYLPTNTPLYGAGSTNAAGLGLYQYTTSTTQTKEGDKPSGHMINIGLHYVAATNGAPIDSDGDGIPDYVEDANGNGVVDWNETDPHNAMTDGTTNDIYNAVYDDIDLSGDGLVGRIKRALGMNPLDAGNPLTLKQIITGEEPDIATFEVPVSYDAVTSSGTLNLNMNGVDVTLEECTRATNGNCLLSFNVDYDPAGWHYLSAGFRLGTEPAADHPVMIASGGIQPFYSGNSVQFFESGSMFDDTGAYLDARLFVQEADYTIDLYDTSTTPRTWIMSITNSTDNGMIQEDWGVTNADGTPFTGTNVEAVFNVLPAGTLSSASAMARPMRLSSGNNNSPNGPTKNLTRAAGSLSEWGPNFDVAYFYVPTNDALRGAFGIYSGVRGDIWMGMQGVVDVLLSPVTSSGGNDNHYNSSFDRCTDRDFPGQPGIPGYVTSRADVTNGLRQSLTDGLTKQFYCYGHGTNGWMGDWAGDAYITGGDVAQWLGNGYSKTNFVTQNPYRFVFLDGCATASGNAWRRVFGIYPLDQQNEAGRNNVGRRLMWAGPTFIPAG